MKIEKRLGGSLLFRTSASIRIILVLFGITVLATAFLQEPRDYAKLFLGVLGALVPFALAAFLDQSRFDFDVSKRRLSWRRKNLFRTLSGEISFDDISDVYLRSRLDTEYGQRKGRTQNFYRVVLATRSGELPLSNTWSADERGQSQIAETIRAVLGKSSGAPLKNEIDDLVAAGQTIDAVKLARERMGLSLTEAKKFIDDKIRLRTSSPNV